MPGPTKAPSNPGASLKLKAVRYWRYFLSILKHKRRVLKACWQEGLYWQGVTHDLSKFLPDEFFSSILFFEGAELTDAQRDRAQRGLLKHYHRNPHHPEHWLLKPGKALPLPRRYLLELLCDWRAFSTDDEAVRAWYSENKDGFTFHPDTRADLETLLDSWIPSNPGVGVKKPTPRSNET